MISLADLQERIASGALTANDAVARSLNEIRTRDQDLHAFVRRTDSAAASSGKPLSGVAIGVKDIIDTADFPTEMGSLIYRDWRPRADAAVVAMLKKAGATIVGKTATTAFAARDPAPTVNPHNRAHTPGGSSAGSAAAVAAGMVPLAIGTQTAGSIIRPASFCGVAAIKPSYDLLPTIGMKCFSKSLDTVGLFAAGVRDLAQALHAMTSRPEFAGISPAEEMRIGVATQGFAGAAEPASEKALAAAVRAAERAGARVRPIDLPDSLAEAWRAHQIVQNYEAHQALAWEYKVNRDALAPLLRQDLDASAGLTSAQYDEALEISRRARLELGEAFADFDVLLAYSAPGAAPQGLSSTGDPRFNRLWTLMRTPCVNVPVRSAGELPVGVQVIAKVGDDAGALAAALFLERALVADI